MIYYATLERSHSRQVSNNLTSSAPSHSALSVIYTCSLTNQLDLAGPPQSRDVSELLEHPHQVDHDDGS